MVNETELVELVGGHADGRNLSLHPCAITLTLIFDSMARKPGCEHSPDIRTKDYVFRGRRNATGLRLFELVR